MPVKKDLLLAAYREVCHSYHAVDDFRAKLLALLPIASGAGGILLLTNDALREHLGPIGLFGLAITFGLFVYEYRGLNNCGRFIEVGKELEGDLRLENAMFKGEPRIGAIEKKLFGFDGARTAAYTVYFSVMIGWIYVAYAGFSSEAFTGAAWNAIEKRHPKFAAAYKIQQASLIAYEAAASSSSIRRVTPSLCDLHRYQQVYLVFEGLQSTKCDPSNRIVVNPGMATKIAECWNKFEQCEAADLPADCKARRDSCMSGG